MYGPIQFKINWESNNTMSKHCINSCDCEKCKPPDRDYFQSVQAEQQACGTEPIGTELLITEECEALKNLLIEKNRAYGDSALRRGKIFDISPVEAIKARINDKASRLFNSGLNDKTEDTLQDIMGYMVLLRIALRDAGNL